jgi:hypothetical protein
MIPLVVYFNPVICSTFSTVYSHRCHNVVFPVPQRQTCLASTYFFICFIGFIDWIPQMAVPHSNNLYDGLLFTKSLFSKPIRMSTNFLVTSSKQPLIPWKLSFLIKNDSVQIINPSKYQWLLCRMELLFNISNMYHKFSLDSYQFCRKVPMPSQIFPFFLLKHLKDHYSNISKHGGKENANIF